MPKKLFFLFLLFSQNFFSFSLGEFLVLDKLLSIEDLNCEKERNQFNQISFQNLKNEEKNNFLLTQKIIQRNCSENLGEISKLDEELLNEINLNSEIGIRLFIYFSKDVILPYAKYKDFKEATFLFEITKEKLKELVEENIINLEQYNSILNHITNDFISVSNWELATKAYEEWASYLFQKLVEIDLGYARPEVIASDLLYLRFRNIDFLLFEKKYTKLREEVKKIFEVYFYDEMKNIKGISYKEAWNEFNKAQTETSENQLRNREILKITVDVPLFLFTNLGDVFGLLSLSDADNYLLNYKEKYLKMLEDYLTKNKTYEYGYLSAIENLMPSDNFDSLGRSKSCKFLEVFSEEILYNKLDTWQLSSFVRVSMSCLNGLELITSEKFIDHFVSKRVKDALLSEEDAKVLYVGDVIGALSSQIYRDIYSTSSESFLKKRKNINDKIESTFIKLTSLLKNNNKIDSFDDLLLTESLMRFISPWYSGGFLDKTLFLKLRKIILEKFVFDEIAFANWINKNNKLSEIITSSSTLNRTFNQYLSFTLSESFFEGETLDLELVENYRQGFVFELYEKIIINDAQKEELLFFSETAKRVINIFHKRLFDLYSENEANSLSFGEAKASGYGLESSIPVLLKFKFPYDESHKALTRWYNYFEILPKYLDNKEKLDFNYPYLNTFLDSLDYELVSDVSLAYIQRDLKNLYNDEIFDEAWQDYYQKVKEHQQLQDSYINFKPTQDGSEAIDGFQSKLAEIRKAASQRFLDVYRIERNGKTLFKFSDLTNKMSVSKLKNSLGENESLLLVSLSKTSADPGFVIYVDRDQVKIQMLQSKYFFETKINELTSSVMPQKNGKLIDSWLSPAKDLYDQLLDFVPKSKTKKQKVYLVNDPLLSELPFSLLFNKDENKFAFENFDFVYLESLSHFLSLKKIPESRLKKNMSYVAFADPLLLGSLKDTSFKNLFATERGLGNVDLINNLSRIPDTSEEVIEISKNFINSNLFLQEKASEKIFKSKKVKSLFKKADIISFATHTFSDSTSYTNEFGLVLSPPNNSSDTDDGLLTSKELIELELDGSTVILSACNTNQPIFKGAPPFSGLIKYFIEAGANGVVFTNWNIDSLSAKIFMTETISLGVKKELSFSAAISSTMKRFVEGDFGEQYRHPYYWAPYQILGSN